MIAKDVLSYSNIINIHDNGFALTQIILKFLSPKSKIIWQINDLPPYFRLGNLKDTRRTMFDAITRGLYKKCAKSASRITVNVTKNAERVKDHYDVDATVVYCGVDLRYSKLKPKLEKKNTIQLVSIGVFFPYRNYETFLKVVDYINQDLAIPCEGIIVGSTALAEDYARTIQDKITINNINCKILGNISEERLNAICEESDAFLFLNKDQSWGLAVFEAMNMGLPVFVSDSVGATELLTNKINAIIVNPDDHINISQSIVKYLNSPNRNDLRENAFNHTLAMTWDNMYSSKIEVILHEL
ncbi:MAG: glycosyltransferase [Pedobacter sp.]|nr:MAG: glycosyltransferase [Pedobacter sp.]